MLMESNSKIPVSVSVIAYNEETAIASCLESVKEFGDIVVVVDSKTTDMTAEIAGEFGCRVFREEWAGDGPQKQKAIDKCNFDWVLMLDADERLPSESLEIIKGALKHRPADAYRLRRKNFIGDRAIRHSGWWPDRLVRLFNKKKCRVKGLTHSSVSVQGKILDLEALIEHRSFQDYADMIARMNTYSSWIANELFLSGRRCNCLTPLVHSTWMFFRTYFLKLGFMDGLDGIVISFMNAGGSFLKYAKLLDLQRRNGIDS
jgi:glycosyltransferase involved in cell wall biosynthesis